MEQEESVFLSPVTAVKGPTHKDQGCLEDGRLSSCSRLDACYALWCEESFQHLSLHVSKFYGILDQSLLVSSGIKFWSRLAGTA